MTSVFGLLTIVLALLLPSSMFFNAQTPAGNPAVTPAARTEGWWLGRHKAKLEEVKKNKSQIDLLFVGDSITQNYEKTGPAPDQDFLPIWQEYFAPHHALNLGFSGDKTQDVLWRIENGEVDGLAPHNIVLLIGTNNTSKREPADEVTAGIIAIAEELHQRMPAAKITLIEILPHGMSPEISALDASVNTAVRAHYAGSSYVHTLDLSGLFMENGVLQNNLFYDYSTEPRHAAHHPNAAGQRRMAAAVAAALYGKPS
jgi:lysophospholipase L1-like esterase